MHHDEQMDERETMEQRIRDGFARQAFMRTIGASLTRVVAGEVEIHLPCSDALTQHMGVLHAGVVTAVVDSACGAAAATLMRPDRDVVSVEFKINLLAPATGDALRAIGRVVRAGRTLTVCAGEVWAVAGADSQIVAVMQATMMAVANSDSRVR
jgi:uncharacterized protein (TIGR00369 family)